MARSWCAIRWLAIPAPTKTSIRPRSKKLNTELTNLRLRAKASCRETYHADRYRHSQKKDRRLSEAVAGRPSGQQRTRDNRSGLVLTGGVVDRTSERV